jgi:hypothetical protein
MLTASGGAEVARAIDAVLDDCCALPPAEYDERVLSTEKLIGDVAALMAHKDEDDLSGGKQVRNTRIYAYLLSL